MIMVGSGQIETQPISEVAILPETSVIPAQTASSSSDSASGTSSVSSGSSKGTSDSQNVDSGATAGLRASFATILGSAAVGLALLL